ncbi:unnamed protein product, partial [Staurois parvus]
WLHSRVPTAHVREVLRFVNGPIVFWDLSAVSGHLLYYVHSLWSFPVLSLQSLVISCSTSAFSGHFLYYVCSFWSSPVVCPQSLVISCSMSRSLWSSPVVSLQSAVSGHLLYHVRSLWSPVVCPQSLGHSLYCPQ